MFSGFIHVVSGVSETRSLLRLNAGRRSSGGGNGNPLQSSCLENPRDGGAWQAAVSGVAQSRTCFILSFLLPRIVSQINDLFPDLVEGKLTQRDWIFDEGRFQARAETGMVYFSGGVDSLSLKGQSTNFPCRQNVAAVNSTIPPTSSADSSSFSHLSFSKVSKGSGRHPVSQGFFLNSQWISTASALTSQLSPSKATFLATDSHMFPLPTIFTEKSITI